MQSLVNTGFAQESIGCRATRALKPQGPSLPNLLRMALGPVLLVLAMLVSPPNAAAGSFSNAVPLITARGNQTATLLSNGKLLVTGGQTNGGFTTAAAELYDPTSGIWTLGDPMNADRAQHTATMLPSGKVLAAGGFSSANGALAS